VPDNDNSMPPSPSERIHARPPALESFLHGAAGTSLPDSLAWKDGMWAGPSSVVNYPDDGHDVLPIDPSNWWYAHRAAVVVSALNRTPIWPRVIWDVGGGTGLMEPALRAAGWRTALVEPVARAASQAIGRADLVIAAPLEDLALPDACVPAIGMFDVLEHLNDPVATLRECARVLKPGGAVIVTVPSHQWLWSDTDEAAGHQLRYSPKVLRRHAMDAGLSLTESRRFFVALVPGAAAMRLARRRHRDPVAVLARERAMLNPPAGQARLLKYLVATDRLTAGRLRAPFGLSLLGVLRKTS